MILKHFTNGPLAQYSYLLGCPASGEALVIDADRNFEQYIEAAEAEGLRIVAVTETHIHADYLSGSRELAEKTGATLYQPGQGGPDWTYAYSNPSGTVSLNDGDEIKVGGFKVVAWHTPGHTPEHVSFVLYETESTPLGAFTGDFVFVGDVGRPDLLENAAGIMGTAEPGARDLFKSLERFKSLPDHLMIWPAHGAGSACGKALGGVPHSTLGYEKLTNWAFKINTEDEFVTEVLSGQPEPPKYFAMMKHLNKVGPGMRTNLPGRSDSLDQFKKDLADPNKIVVDIRPSTSYMEEHVPGVLHIPIFGGTANWAGWLIDYDKEIVLIANCDKCANGWKDQAGSIGLDKVTAWYGKDIVRQYAEENKTLSYDTTLGEQIEGGSTFLDVRGINEYNEDHLENAIHIPLGYLEDRTAELSKDETLYVHCASGRRSPIALSVLERNGFSNIVNVHDGLNSLKTQKQLVTQS